LKPPIAKKARATRAVHGAEVADDYGWLKDQASPDVKAYLEAENAYTEAMMKPTEALQKTLYDEMLGRITQGDSTVPYEKDGYLYYQRTEAGKQYPIYCRKAKAKSGAKEPPREAVLLDLNEIGKTEKYVGVKAFEVSDDGETLVYGLDTTGSRDYTLHVVDLKTGKALPEKFSHGTTASFTKDKRTLFYVVEDPKARRPYRLYRHEFGADPSKDALVYEEKDEQFMIEVARSRSGDFIFATSLSMTTTEVRYIDAKKPADPPKLIAAREPGHQYRVDHRGDSFYIRTNAGAPNYRLVTAKVADPSRAQWKEVLAHREDVVLENVDIFASHIVLRERKDGVKELRILDDKKGTSTNVKMPEELHALWDQPNVDFKATTYRYTYESPLTPTSVYEYDIKAQKSSLLKKTEVQGGYDPSRYEGKRAYAVAPDGARIPLSIVARKDLPKDGKSPLLLYSYGAYGWSVDDKFTSNIFSLLDRGFVSVVAHVRGGGELGEKWHDAGRLMQKKNTFTDYIASAEWLIKEGYTSKDRLVASGLSAGGLLIGAVLNARPDLFKVAVAQVPFVDVTTTMLDPTLPGTIPDYEEWGNPETKSVYDYISSYSPYDNISANAYPTLLVTASLNDPLVPYWGPAKYVAKLRAMKKDQNPLLFKVNMAAGGHAGKSGRFDKLKDEAFLYAFLLTQVPAKGL